MSLPRNPRLSAVCSTRPRFAQHAIHAAALKLRSPQVDASSKMVNRPPSLWPLAVSPAASSASSSSISRHTVSSIHTNVFSTSLLAPRRYDSRFVYTAGQPSLSLAVRHMDGVCSCKKVSLCAESRRRAASSGASSIEAPARCTAGASRGSRGAWSPVVASRRAPRDRARGCRPAGRSSPATCRTRRGAGEFGWGRSLSSRRTFV